MNNPRSAIPRRALPLLLLAPLATTCATPNEPPHADQPSRPPAPDWPDLHAEYDALLGDTDEYRAIQRRLASGWNTWDSRSVLRFVLLPEGLAVDVALKRHDFLDEGYLPAALIGRSGDDVEVIRPGPRAVDGSFGSFNLEWQGLSARIEFGHDDGELVALLTPEVPAPYAFEAVVSVGMVWNRPGAVEAAGDGFTADLPSRETKIHILGTADRDPYAGRLAPYRALRLDRPVGIHSGPRKRTLEELRASLDRARGALEARAAGYGELAEAWTAVTSAVGWNTIYEPRHERVVSTVGRLWNQEYGGVALFGWDNFFLSWLAVLEGPDLALANAIEHLRGHTDEGFLPNDNRGNGSKSWDRSQPPVGAVVLREVIRRFPEPWFEEAVFDPLLAWNRWWPTARDNGGLLSYGSHAARNPFNEPVVRTKTAAGYESGMDDSPMYEDVPFNPENNTLELQDVGLTSLYVADCRALAEIARRLGRTPEAEELEARGDRYAEALERLWVEDRGYYLNYRTDLDRFSERRSPTLFYPLLARAAPRDRAARMVREHLLDPEQFWGDFVLPSTTRDDPSFPRQRYWKGAIWPPLNFLTWLGLRTAGEHETAAELSRRSLEMFLTEWRRKGYVSENLSSITGAGDDARLSSDPFHTWGALFGFMAFIESDLLEPPENPLPARRTADLQIGTRAKRAPIPP